MRRRKILFIILLTSIIFIPTTLAANRAYSVGSKYAQGVYEAGSDFTQNVLNAANAYGKLSGYTSYYNNVPDYSYMKGSRLGSSQVYFINGHANRTTIFTAAKNSDDYRTGISIYKDGTRLYDKDFNHYYKVAGLDGRDMSKTKLITFAGCNTASANGTGGTATGSDLTSKAYLQGATTTVGFSKTITSRSDAGKKWLQKYNTVLASGGTVKKAISDATVADSNSNLGASVIIWGSTTTLGSPKKISPASTFSKEYPLLSLEEKEDLKSIEDVYHFLDIKKSIEFDLSNKEKEGKNLNLIFEEIKKEDPSFKPEEYIISYNLVNAEENFGFIFITYFIDGIIETNKKYMVEINNNKVDKIILSGVKERNISSINSINNIILIEKVTNFNNNEKATKLSERASEIFKSENILVKSKKIDTSKLKDSIFEYKEKYYYDYNSGKLSYILTTYEETELYIRDGEEIIFDLN